MEQQYGIRWPTGSVFAFGSQDEAEAELDRDGRGFGVLVVHEYEAGTPNCTEWREVAAAAEQEHTDCPAHGTDHERYAGGCLDCPACINLRAEAARQEDGER